MSAPTFVSNQQSVPMTPDGHRRLRELLDELRGAGRAEISERLREARDDGGSPADNPELMHALEEQIRLERRIADLESRLARAEVVEGDAGSDGRVVLGSRVVLQRLDGPGGPVEYELVSSLEADPSRGMLSSESPIGAAVLGHRARDEIEVEAPSGPVRFRVEAVELPELEVAA